VHVASMFQATENTGWVDSAWVTGSIKSRRFPSRLILTGSDISDYAF
jgi:hypothetical protein